MPEFAAPGLGKRSNHVAIDVQVGEEASGVLYALGGASGGVTLYMDKGRLVYEYNMLIIERTIAKSEAKITPGSIRSRSMRPSPGPALRRMSSSRSMARKSPGRR